MITDKIFDAATEFYKKYDIVPNRVVMNSEFFEKIKAEEESRGGSRIPRLPRKVNPAELVGEIHLLLGPTGQLEIVINDKCDIPCVLKDTDIDSRRVEIRLEEKIPSDYHQQVRSMLNHMNELNDIFEAKKNDYELKIEGLKESLDKKDKMVDTAIEEKINLEYEYRDAIRELKESHKQTEHKDVFIKRTKDVSEATIRFSYYENGKLVEKAENYYLFSRNNNRDILESILTAEYGTKITVKAIYYKN